MSLFIIILQFHCCIVGLSCVNSGCVIWINLAFLMCLDGSPLFEQSFLLFRYQGGILASFVWQSSPVYAVIPEMYANMISEFSFVFCCNTLITYPRSHSILTVLTNDETRRGHYAPYGVLSSQRKLLAENDERRDAQ
jgi:hypothetical protein